MKNKFFLFLFGIAILSNQNFAQEINEKDSLCGTIAPYDGNDVQRINRANLFFQEFSCSPQFRKSSVGCVTIPVVVHVIHLGGEENISDAQINSQIDIYNENFLKIPGTHGDGDGVNTNIGFALATVDPIGNPTSGIIRIQNSLTAHNPELASRMDNNFQNISALERGETLLPYFGAINWLMLLK